MLKNFTQKLFALSLLTISLVSPSFAAVDYQVEHQPQVIEKDMICISQLALKFQENLK
jgi:hypothetical protein